MDLGHGKTRLHLAVIPAKAGIWEPHILNGIPAFAGMTNVGRYNYGWEQGLEW
jgi:hypothetical protein